MDGFAVISKQGDGSELQIGAIVGLEQMSTRVVKRL